MFINPKAISSRLSVPVVNLEITHSQILLSPVAGRMALWGRTGEKSHILHSNQCWVLEFKNITSEKHGCESYRKHPSFLGEYIYQKTHSSDVSSSWEVATSKIFV